MTCKLKTSVLIEIEGAQIERECVIEYSRNQTRPGTRTQSAGRGGVMSEPDLITMSLAQCLVLDRMSDDLSYPMRDIAADTGVPEKSCLAIVRRFHTLNMTGFGVLHDQDSSELRGRGYWLVRLGSNLKRQMRDMLCVPLEDDRFAS